MDRINLNFALAHGRPRAVFNRHRFVTKSRYYFSRLQPARGATTLVLIAHPAIATTVLSDRMVRIEAAKAASPLMALASRCRLRVVASLAACRPKKNYLAAERAFKPHLANTADANPLLAAIATANIRTADFRTADFRTADIRIAAALDASLQLKIWLTAQGA